MQPTVKFISCYSSAEYFGQQAFLLAICAVNDRVILSSVVEFDSNDGKRKYTLSGEHVQETARATAKGLNVPVLESMIDVDDDEVRDALARILDLSDTAALDLDSELLNMAPETLLAIANSTNFGWHKDFHDGVQKSLFDEFLSWEALEQGYTTVADEDVYEVLADFGLTLEAIAWHTQDVCDALAENGFKPNIENIDFMFSAIKDRIGGSGTEFRDLILRSIIWEHKDKLEHQSPHHSSIKAA